MNPEIEYRLFKKFYNKGIELRYGVTFDIDLSNNKTVFTMNNPNGVSYSKPSINGHIFEKYEDFYTSLGIDFNYGEFKNKFILKNVDTLYLSNEFIGRVSTALKEIDTLNFSFFKDNNKNSWVSEYGGLLVEHTNFEIKLDEDSVRLINYVDVIKSFLRHNEIDNDEGISLYEESQIKDRYDESERNYSELDRILNDYSLLCDDWQVYSTHTEFNQ